VFWLNKKGFFSLAKYFFILTVSLEVFMGSSLLDSRANIYLYYFPLVIATLILFDYRDKVKSFTLLLCLIGLYLFNGFYTEVNWRVEVSPFAADVLFFSTLANSLLLTILCVYHLMEAEYHVEKQLSMAISTEEELNRELVVREEELTANLEHLSKLSSEIDSEKAKLSAIVENTNHYIWSFDCNYRLVYYNSRYSKLFYYRFGVEVKAGDDVTKILPEPIASQWKIFYDRALAGKKFSVELPGENFYKELFFNPIIDNNKQTVGVTVFMQNINDRKEAEIQLIAAKEIAEQANRVKSDFLSNMSHEIRTPMNAVIGLSNLLLEQNPRPDQVELLEVLHFSSENLLSLINDILDMQKIEAGKIVFEEVDFSLKELLNNIIYAFKFKADEKGIGLHYRIDESLPAVLRGDSVRLTQILNNLLSNAIKFTDKGIIQLEVNLLGLPSDMYQLQFKVTDTGIGIASEKLDSIFIAFEQAGPDTTRKYGGTGLGLTITKKLIELQKGSIWVESTVGAGSAFYFNLPFKKGVSPATYLMVGRSYQKADLGHIRLLMAEDNQVNVMVAQKFLQKWNIRADVVENGEEAVRKVQEQTYDIILMDLQMPVMDGMEAARVIRSLPQVSRSLPIIALTADVSADVKERIKEAGMNQYLAKPFYEKDLYEVIAAYVSPQAENPAGTEAIPSNALTAISYVKEINYQQVNWLADGDNQFMHELLDACLSNVSELQESYTLSMMSKNIESLRKSMHKFNSMLHLLGLGDLQSLLERSKQILQTNTANSEELSMLVRQTDEECSWVRAELYKFKSANDCTYTNS
jgi:PAS domain S-box-containing protein